MTKFVDDNRYAALADEDNLEGIQLELSEDSVAEPEKVDPTTDFNGNESYESKSKVSGFFPTLNIMGALKTSFFLNVIARLGTLVDAGIHTRTWDGTYTLGPTPGPTGHPSGQPSGYPTSVPTYSSPPSLQPSSQPSSGPTSDPTSQPSFMPTLSECGEFLRGFINDCANKDLSLEETTMAVGRCYENGDMNITEFVRDDYCDPDFNLKRFFGNFTETCLNTTSVAAQNVTQLCTNDLVHLRGSDDDNEFSYVPIAIAGGILICCCATAAAAYACSKSKEVVPEGKI
jgi:hypothetical protein